MKLLLVRHARTTAVDGFCYGRTDVPVLPEVTRAVAERVAPELPEGVSLTCSPLSRCSELAQAIVALRPDLAVAGADPRIAEMDLGEWEEQLWSAIDRAEIDAWTRDFADVRAGRSGECTRQFMRRVGEAFDAWRAGGRDAVWITHAGVIRCAWLLRDGIRAIERSDQWPGQPIAFGECITIEI
ncbi:histidine phosphatase family protein [Variovorax sp. J31P207]|uniref:histidine phosphatase family protein n=1 Tax=Variovorax sp. J31P207 TaxID=3053510 RepID=UPI0025789A09|nr:histidine phosphatase family protein [Variovorax sp. J31P207]MDM0067905.1 histidine phosphatase family protein [Variovorax sp. J31P207]